MKSFFANYKQVLIHFFVLFAISLAGCEPTTKQKINIQSENGSSEYYSGDKPDSSDTANEQPSTSTGDTSCPGAPPQRVDVGDRAIVSTKSDRLIVREDGYKGAPEITRLPPGKTFTIIGGPICDESSNWSYWKIRTDGGVVGWVSEGGDSIDDYFFSPVD